MVKADFYDQCSAQAKLQRLTRPAGSSSVDGSRPNLGPTPEIYLIRTSEAWESATTRSRSVVLPLVRRCASLVLRQPSSSRSYDCAPTSDCQWLPSSRKSSHRREACREGVE